jgi:serine/threonine-protein kinase
MPSRLAYRAFWGSLLGIAAVLAAVLGSARVGARRAAAATAERGLEQAADLVAQLLAGRSRSLAGGARVFVQGPYFRTLVAERRRDDILDQTFEAAVQLDASWVFITDANGVLVAKSDEPSASGDAMAGIPLVSGALRGQITTGFGGSGDSLLFLATAVPITAPGGSAFGVLVATTRLDSALAADIAVATGSNVVFYLRDADGRANITAATVPLDAAARGALHQALDTGAIAATRNATGLRLEPQAVTIGDSTWYSYASALNTAGGVEVGGYLVLRPAASSMGSTTWLRDAALVGVLLALALAALAAWFMDRSMATPLRLLAARVRRAADGYVDGHFDAPTMFGPMQPEVHDVGASIAAWQSAIHDAHLVSAVVGTPTPSDPPVVETPRGRVRRADGALTLPVPRTGEAGPMHLEEGDWVAHRYRVHSGLGGGPSGVVYRAFDRSRNETVALKMLRPELVATHADVRDARFDVVRSVQALVHAHVVPVHDIGEALGTVFLTSDYVDGVSLRTLLDRAPMLSPPVVAALARQLLRALAALHARGVVHGDLKPSNVLITASGVVRVTDAGIGRVVGRLVDHADAAIRPRERESSAESAADSRIFGRVIGGAVGAPDYLAPEQLIGAPASVVGDLYAVGIMLQEAEHGEPSAERSTPLDGLTARLRQTPGLGTPVPSAAARIALSSPASASALDGLIAALLSPEPAARPQSARAALTRLDASARETPAIERDRPLHHTSPE